jgi:hypothetical protein
MDFNVVNINKLLIMKIGIELSEIDAANRSRGNYLVHELRNNGYNASFVEKDEIVDIRILLKRDFFRKKRNEILIFDISDAILIPPRSRSFIRKLYHKYIFNRKYGLFFKMCDAVVVACDFQKRSILNYNEKTFVIEDSSHYHHSYNNRKDEIGNKIIFVWDGQSPNLKYLMSVLKKNIDFFKKDDVIIKVITDLVNPITKENNKDILSKLGINCEFIEWNKHTFMNEVAKGHIGLAPLDIFCPHAFAKPCNKMINYQGLGMGIIASKIPSYFDFSINSPGKIIICNDDSDWLSALEYFRLNKDKMVNSGVVGRRYVIENYAPENIIRKWINVIESLSQKKN